MEAFKPYHGLDLDELAKIRDAYPTLRKIQTITSVPWQAVAAIWYRESFSIAPPARPGGPYQFDPIPSPGALQGLLDRFTQLPDEEKRAIVDAGVNHFYEAGILAACFLRIKTKPLIHPHCADEVIKDALWGYNGKAYGSADRSPYVMNGYDKAHFPMEFHGTVPGKDEERIPVSGMDTRPGAFTIYKQLKILFP